MLVIPVSDKISWRHPPLATIGLILVNCLVFFVFQSGEHEAYNNAMDYYFESHLAEIEIRAYINFIDDQNPKKQMPSSNSKLTAKQIETYYPKMKKDYNFLKKLRAEEIISPTHPEYDDWRTERNLFEKKLNRVVYLKYGYTPSSPNVVSAFSYMFLHAGFGHLLGNMIFLWLVGCMLEVACGRIFLLSVYLLTGLTSVGLFGLIYMDSTIPLVGASGAIAGFMGAFAVAFGLMKVRIFFSFGFYFNYLKIPAVVLLPVWIGNELIQLFFTGVARVAYVAHIGGLIGGALIGLISLKILKNIDFDAFAEEPVDPTLPYIEEAMHRMSELDLVGSRRQLEMALEISPNNINALRHLFNVDKNNLDNGKIHGTTHDLLKALIENDKEYDAAYSIYKEYTALELPQRLGPVLCARLSAVFTAAGHLDTAEALLIKAINQKPDLQLIPPIILRLSQAFKARGDMDRFQTYNSLLVEKYSNTSEAHIANRDTAGGAS